MTSPSRFLFALILAILLALPSISGDGGENGGGTGVWVLPRATFLASGVVEPRAVQQVTPGQDLILEMSSEVGMATAVFVDDLSQVPISLPVNGLNVRMPAAVMQSFLGCSAQTATIMISDASHMGYLIRVVTQSNGTLSMQVL